MASNSVDDFQQRFDDIERTIQVCVHELSQLRKRSEAVVAASQKAMDKSTSDMLNLAITLANILEQADRRLPKLIEWMRPTRKDELVRRSERSLAIAKKNEKEIRVIQGGFELLSKASKVVFDDSKDLARKAVSFQCGRVATVDQQR
jgi:predicted transcriptional regulator